MGMIKKGLKMEDTLLKLVLVVAGLIIVGIALTAYEFREHILKRFKKKQK
jgi:hypothetical protein